MYGVCFFVLLLIATRATSEQQKVVERFEEHAIVPSIISPSPPVCLIVKYAGNVTVKLGNELLPFDTKDSPINVTWPGVESDSLYTLIMLDPDAPSRKMPLVSEVIHWLVINAHPSNFKEGQEIVPYLGN